MDEKQLDGIAQSFKLENRIPRKELNDTLAAHKSRTETVKVTMRIGVRCCFLRRCSIRWSGAILLICFCLSCCTD